SKKRREDREEWECNGAEPPLPSNQCMEPPPSRGSQEAQKAAETSAESTDFKNEPGAAELQSGSKITAQSVVSTLARDYKISPDQATPSEGGPPVAPEITQNPLRKAS